MGSYEERVPIYYVGGPPPRTPAQRRYFYRFGNDKLPSARKSCHAAGEFEPNASDV